jgi:hypothetical protein
MAHKRVVHGTDAKAEDGGCEIDLEDDFILPNSLRVV